MTCLNKTSDYLEAPAALVPGEVLVGPLAALVQHVLRGDAVCVTDAYQLKRRHGINTLVYILHNNLSTKLERAVCVKGSLYKGGRLLFSLTDQFIVIVAWVKVFLQEQGGQDAPEGPDVDGICDGQAQDYLRSSGQGEGKYTSKIR